MSEEISQSFSFRYIFEDEKQHEISAETLLTSELSLLDYIHRFSKKTGIQVGLVYKTREPGSVQDYFDLVWSNPLFQASAAFIIKDVLTAIIKKFISPNPKNKLSDEESTKLNIANYIDLKSKFEAGKLTAEEVNAFLDNDSKLKKYKSIFWKSVKDDSQIKKVEIKRDTNVIQLVQRPDFDSRIIDEKQENLDNLIKKLKEKGYNKLASKLVDENIKARNKIELSLNELPRCVYQGDLNYSNILVDDNDNLMI